MTDQSADKYDLLYKENAKIIATFWEWRHKGMTYFSAGITAVFTLAAWLYTQGGFLRKSSFAPLIVGPAFSLVALLLDKRNAKILARCYSVAQTIESTFQEQNKVSKDAAIFSVIGQQQYSWPSYTRVLCALYLSSAILLLILSVIIAVVSLMR